MGCVPLIEPPGKSNVAGDFHRPYETLNVWDFTIHRGTCETGRVRAIFIAPTKGSEDFAFCRATENHWT